MISNCLCIFGAAPDIIIAYKDIRLIANAFRDFGTKRNITLRKVIPGHLQSLGATDRRHRDFMDVTEQLTGKKKHNNAPSNDW